MAKTTNTTITEAENDKSVDVKAGDIILLHLPENPTTGYRWAFDALDEAKLELVKSEYVRQGNAVGSGGLMTWKLKAKTKGNLTLKLKLWRSFEGNKPSNQHFSVALKIK